MDTFNTPSAPVSDVDTTIQVSSGTPTFDDFDRVENVTKELNDLGEKKAKKAEKKAAEKEAMEKEGNEKIPQSKGKEEKVEDAPEEEEVKGEETPNTSSEEKKFLDHSGEELIQVKINGKMEEVKLSDLKANYSGKIAYDKKFSEFDKERKQFQAEKQQLIVPIQKFKQLIADGKAGDALLHILDTTGEDAYTFNNKLIRALTPIIQERLSMSPEQLEALDARSEVEHLRKKEQSLAERTRSEQSHKELVNRIEKLKETHSISEDDFQKAAENLKRRLDADGKYKKEEFTPELVANFHLASKYSDRAFKAIDSVDKNLGDDPKLASELIDLMFTNPEISHNDLVDLIREYAGVNDKLKVLTQKSQVEKKVQASNQRAGQKQNRPEFFSDFDD